MLMKGCFSSSIGHIFQDDFFIFFTNAFFCEYHDSHIKLIYIVYFEIDLIVQKCAKDILKNLRGGRLFAHAMIVIPKLKNKFAQFFQTEIESNI